MKNTIQFSKRSLQKSSLNLRSSDVSVKRDFASTSTYEAASKPLFKPDQQFLKCRSPEHTRSLFESRANTTGACQSSTINNLKQQLSSLKQQFNKLTCNPFKPLQFKSKLKLDKSVPVISNHQSHENRTCEFKLKDDNYHQPKLTQNQQPDRKNQMTRIKSQYLKQDTNSTSQQSMSGVSNPFLKIQKFKSKKQQEYLKNDLEEVTSECMLFKEQTGQLKEEMKQASEGENVTFQDQKNLTETLSKNRNDLANEAQECHLKECMDVFSKDKSKLGSMRISEIGELKKQFNQLQKSNEILNKELLRLQCEKNKSSETFDEVLRCRNKQISILKQQVAILQQLTSTRTAEDNSLLLQKESYQKINISKENENKRLQKNIIDLKERLESEKIFTVALNEKLTMKNSIIQNLEDKLNSLRHELSLQLPTAKGSPLNESLFLYSKIVNIVVSATVKKQERRRFTSTQTHTPQYQYENDQQQNEDKENLDIVKSKHGQAVFGRRIVQKQARHLTQLKVCNSRIIKHKDEYETFKNPSEEYILDLERQIFLLKTTLDGLEQTNQQLLKHDAERVQQLNTLKSQVQLLTNKINNFNLNISSESEKYKAELSKVYTTNQCMSLQINSLQLINKQLHRDKDNLLIQLQNTKINNMKQADDLRIQLSHVKGQLQHNERTITHMRSNIANLERNAQLLDTLSKRLYKTQETLIQSNSIIYRLNISNLSARLEQQQLLRDELQYYADS